jgi:hypothetical protein
LAQERPKDYFGSLEVVIIVIYVGTDIEFIAASPIVVCHVYRKVGVWDFHTNIKSVIEERIT